MDDEYLGVIKMFAGTFAPRYFAFCYGQLLKISDNQALFSILGTTYGGDGRTTFGLPDLRGRIPMGMGQGPGLTNRTIGSTLGYEDVALTASQMPVHTHDANGTVQGNYEFPSGGGDTINPSGKHFSSAENTKIYTSKGDNVSMANGNVAVQVADAGSGQAHLNIQPSTVINFIICTQGLYPERS